MISVASQIFILSGVVLRQKSPQIALFHLGLVQADLIVVAIGNVELAVLGSVTTQRLFEKHVHPVGQH